MSRKTALAVGAFLIIVLVGCGALGYFVFTRVDAPMVATRASSSVADYRAAGLPWTVADLRTAEKVAPEENAYPIFIKAATSLDEKRLRSELSRLSELSESGKPEAFFEAIEPYRASLEKAERAASLPAYDPGRDWDAGPELKFPELRPARDLAKLLHMRAVAKARSGDTEGAIEDLRSIRRLAVHVGSEPALLSLLVRQRFDRTALNGTRRVASVVAEDREALRLLLKLLREDRPEASLEFALRGEMYLGLTTIRNLEVFGRNRGREDKGLDSIPLDPEKLVRDGIPDDIMRKAFMAQHAEFWIEANKDMSKHRGDPVALGEAFDALAEREFEKPTASKLLNAILVPVVGQVGKSVVSTEAEERTTGALIEALIYKTEAGRLPEEIGELPSRWVDPFTGEPLRIAHRNGSFRIYSVGPDQLDDGGRTKAEMKKPSKRADIVASYPSLPANE